MTNLLYKLTRNHNLYATAEKNDFRLLINRLSSSQKFIDYVKNDEFHVNYIMHVLKYYPVSYLWSYLDYYK